MGLSLYLDAIVSRFLFLFFEQTSDSSMQLALNTQCGNIQLFYFKRVCFLDEIFSSTHYFNR